MSTITTLVGTDGITTANSMAKINTNFSNLNTDKIETSVLDTDTTLAANSDSKIATQKAVKAYVDAGGNSNASTTTKGIVEEATAAEVAAGTATGATGARLYVNPSTMIHTDVQTFTTTGANTWTKPTGCLAVMVTLIGGGGGGGTAFNNSYSGCGGSGGGYVSKIFSASVLGSTETVTVGAGGGSGANGGDTSFGSWLVAGGGRSYNGQGNRSGSGGQGIAAGAAGNTTDGTPLIGIDASTGGASGARGGVTGGQGAIGGNGYMSGAAGGGSGAFGNFSGGQGGSSYAKSTTPLSGANGGAGSLSGTATAGSNATDMTTGVPIPGAGGGGGGGTQNGTAANGGNGGKYGGGGGGAGCTGTGGSTPGIGGSGADGIAQIISYF